MYKKYLKRILDIIISIVALPFFLILFIIIFILIKIDDNGPVFYKSKRIGKDSAIFEMYKFRSMKVHSPNILNDDGSTFNSETDNRVTRIGKFLRKTSIDEIPQILNVFIGNMSLIGPRASMQEALDTYKKDELDKMRVKPGITGYTQAYYRNSITNRAKRLKDSWYANNVSFSLDLKIFFKSIITVLKHDNLYTNNNEREKMGKNYLLISNGNILSNEEYESKKIVKVSSMRKCAIEAILNFPFKFNIYMSINKKYASELKTDYGNKIKLYNAEIYRNILDIKTNYKAYKNLNALLKKEKINIIHCNTPIGGFLGRICGKKNKVEKIIYTAHGFHFYKGAPLINNTIYKSIEKWLSHYTDAIITMNKEDYEAAKKMKLKNNGKVYFTHGVGINLAQYKNIKINKEKYFNELGLNLTDKIIISVGDLVKNKNINLALEIISKINNKNLKYLICGTGPELKKLEKKAEKLNIQKQVIFLGFRNDISQLLKISNVFLSTSKREGLSRVIMEAMASGLPCIVSNIRGNCDLIDNGKGGYLCNSIDEYVTSINKVLKNKKNNENFSKYNLEKIKNYSFEVVKEEIYNIYKEIL